MEGRLKISPVPPIVNKSQTKKELRGFFMAKRTLVEAIQAARDYGTGKVPIPINPNRPNSRPYTPPRKQLTVKEAQKALL